MASPDDIPALIDQLCGIYDTSAANLREALQAYVRDGARPDVQARADGCFAYPDFRADGPSGALRGAA